ncbi:MAG TPA: S8 family serine peptidase [Streptosporangiaceae bacterium]|nr:S8 family serine peptidase [Streptosporangiaceae bacterium]
MRYQSASFGPGAAAQLIKDTANAWKITQGSGVTVAVLSTGVDANAVGLAGKVRTGHDYVPLPYPAPLYGTLIASAIAGAGPTSASPVGPIGRAPQAKILSIRILADGTVPGGTAYDRNLDPGGSVLAPAITEAVNQGAKVIYIGMWEDSPTLQMEQAVQYAMTKNVVLVALETQQGDHSNSPVYPASLPGVIGAGIVSLSGLPAAVPELSVSGNESILVAAPGDQLLASGPNGPDYIDQNEYSANAWLVGTAALIKSVDPNLSPALVARAIALSARDRPAGGYNTTVGFGLINPAGALQQAAALAKLTATAAPGAAVANPSARLASGPAPGTIDAVHHSTVKLAGFGAAIVVGLACLLLAVLLARRGRRGHAGRAAQAGQGSVRIS